MHIEMTHLHLEMAQMTHIMTHMTHIPLIMTHIVMHIMTHTPRTSTIYPRIHQTIYTPGRTSLSQMSSVYATPRH
jgi:hypothetical protein